MLIGTESSWFVLLHLLSARCLLEKAAEVFITTLRYNHCEICCSSKQKKCHGQSEGLCLLEITLFEP